MRGRGRGRGRGVNMRRVQHSINKHQSNLDRGRVIRKLPVAPPVVKISPWFAMTIVKKSAGNLNITTGTIKTWLFEQLGWTSPDNALLRMRFKTIRVWMDSQYSQATSSAGPQSVVIKPYSLIGESYDQIAEDWTAEVRYARVGYIFPRAQQITVFQPSATDVIASLAVSDASAPWVMYIDLEFSSTIDSTSLFSDFERLSLNGDQE